MDDKRVYLFDTTLRDGAQTQGVDFNPADKELIAKELDSIGIDYIEGGCEINMICAIDYTGSNGHPADPKSLHFIGSHPNQYQSAIGAIGSILEAFGPPFGPKAA